jgi:DNA-binding XRE family transcriptional regulator
MTPRSGLPRPGLAEARKRVGHSQKTLAEQLGVTTQTVGFWETGKYNISPSRRRALADALEISLSTLDRIIHGESPDSHSGDSAPDNDPDIRWIVPAGLFPRRPYQPVPRPPAAPILTARDDELNRSRRHVWRLASAIRLPPDR